MIEYALFSQKPFDLFVDFLKEKGLAPQTRQSDDSRLVCLPEDMDRELHALVDAEYDRLLTLDMNLIEADEADESGHQAAAIVLNLKDGSASYASVNPAFMARIMEVLTPEEFGEIVTAIVDAVEQPDARSLCQRLREGEDL